MSLKEYSWKAGWVDGWVEVKSALRLAFRNQKLNSNGKVLKIKDLWSSNTDKIFIVKIEENFIFIVSTDFNELG